MALSSRLDMGPFYVVINRTCQTLQVIVDGRTFVLRPGRNGNIPSAAVPYCFRQHPRLGTFAPGLEGEYLVAVEGVTPKELCRMIPPGEEAKGPERFDRREFPNTQGETVFQKLTTAVGPYDKGPTILDAVEKPGSIELIRENPV